MRAEEIRAVVRSSPFQPFTLHLADGREFEVPHPEFIFVAPSNRRVVLESVDQHLEIIDPLLVVSMSIGNGQSQPDSGADENGAG